MSYEIIQAIPEYSSMEEIKMKNKLMRLDIGTSKRFYYTSRNRITPKFYTSVTTFTNLLPTGQQLIEWYAKHGYEKAKQLAMEAADYGTFMHIEFGKYLLHRIYNWNQLERTVDLYLKKHGISTRFKNTYIDRIEKNMLSVNQWIQDYNVRPIAIEMPVYNDYSNLAGTIDLIAEITESVKGFWGEVYKSGPRKGQPKETKKDATILAMIDFKSGKYFYDSHEMQLHTYHRLWKSAFKDQYVLDKLYNWSPVDFKGDTPTYKFKDQTNFEYWNSIIDSYIHIGKKRGIFNPKQKVTIINEELKFDTPASKIMQEVDITKFVKMKPKELKGKIVIMK